VASISNDGNGDLSLFRLAFLISSSSRVHSDLEASGKSLKVTSLTNITILQSRSHGVHIKEGVFSVLNFGHRLAIHRSMSGVPDSGEVLASTGIGSFNSLEFGIVEVSSVFQISLLGRALSDLQSAEVVLRESLCVRGCELVFGRWAYTFVEFAVNSSSGSFSETLGVDVLRLNLGNITGVSRDVLGLDVVSRSSEPVVSMLGVVAELKGFVEFISSWCVRVKLSLRERWLSYSDIDVVVTGLVSSLCDNLVNISSSASVDVILLGNVTGVAR